MADNSNKKKEVKNNKTKKSFFKDVKAELKKVTWPTTKQVVNNTVGVIIIVVITSIIVFVLDFTFKNFNEYVIKGVKTEISKMSDENTVSDGNAVDDNKTETENNTVSEGTNTENEIIDNTVSE